MSGEQVIKESERRYDANEMMVSWKTVDQELFDLACSDWAAVDGKPAKLALNGAQIAILTVPSDEYDEFNVKIQSNRSYAATINSVAGIVMAIGVGAWDKERKLHDGTKLKLFDKVTFPLHAPTATFVVNHYPVKLRRLYKIITERDIIAKINDVTIDIIPPRQ